jgi:CRISPR/Cas system type I-B associated protein Csh2 (Cas7 group RAMP superfamily)
MDNPNIKNRFNFQVVEEGGNKHMRRKNIRAIMKNGKMKYKQIRELYDALITQGIDASRISVHALGPVSYYTFKSLKEIELKEFDAEDYFKNRAKDYAKFDGFEFCDFVVR